MIAMPLLITVLILVPAKPDVKTTPTSWVGKTVLLKKTGTVINRIDDTGNESPLEELTELDYRVLAERDDRIQLKSRQGTLGWLRKSEVVELAEAPTFFTERIQENPNNSDAYNRRAWAWNLKGERDLAIKDFGASLRLFPDAAIYNNRGAAYHAKKDYDKAMGDYSEAIRLNPMFVLPFFNRALVWEAKKEYDRAIEDYNEALRIDPKYVSAVRNRGLMKYYKKDHEQAIADFTEAIRLDPRDVNAHNDRGNAHLARKEHDKAIADFSEAMRIDPQFVHALSNRGLAWHAKKEYEKALADYTEALRVNPKFGYAHIWRAKTLIAMKEYARARTDYDAALRLDPANANLHNEVSWMLATCPDEKGRDGKRAVELGKRALELNRTANIMDTLAAAYAEIGDFTEAVRWQEQALMDPVFQQNETARQRLELYRKKQPYRQK